MSETPTAEIDAPTYDELVVHVRYLSTTVDLLRQVIGTVLPAHSVHLYADDLRRIDQEYRYWRDELTRVIPPGSGA